MKWKKAKKIRKECLKHEKCKECKYVGKINKYTEGCIFWELKSTLPCKWKRKNFKEVS